MFSNRDRPLRLLSEAGACLSLYATLIAMGLHAAWGRWAFLMFCACYATRMLAPSMIRPSWGDHDPDGDTITVVRSYSMTLRADRAGVVPDVPFRPTPPDIRGGTIMFHEIPGFDVECHRGVAKDTEPDLIVEFGDWRTERRIGDRLMVRFGRPSMDRRMLRDIARQLTLDAIRDMLSETADSGRPSSDGDLDGLERLALDSRRRLSNRFDGLFDSDRRDRDMDDAIRSLRLRSGGDRRERRDMAAFGLDALTILAAIAAYLALPVRETRTNILVLALVGLVVLSLMRREHMGEGLMSVVRRALRGDARRTADDSGPASR